MIELANEMMTEHQRKKKRLVIELVNEMMTEQEKLSFSMTSLSQHQRS